MELIVGTVAEGKRGWWEEGIKSFDTVTPHSSRAAAAEEDDDDGGDDKSVLMYKDQTRPELLEHKE